MRSNPTAGPTDGGAGVRGVGTQARHRWFLRRAGTWSGVVAGAACALTALALAACRADSPVSVSVTGSASRTLSADAGSEIDITLQTIGPGEYASPPAISSASVRFLGASLVGPAVPAGPTQRFRFRAVASGRAIIGFQHTGQGPAVEDTVDVR